MSSSAVHEALLFALITAVLAITYSRLRFFDLTAGFWAVIAPHLIDGLQTGRISSTSPYALSFLAIFLIQVLTTILFAQTLTRYRELYTLLSFFLSLGLSSIAALGLLPSSTATLPIHPLLPWAMFVLSIGLLLSVIAIQYARPFSQLLFISGFPQLSLSTRLYTGTLIAWQVFSWSIIGCLITSGHLGLLAKGELISIFCITAVAAVRPSDVPSILKAALLAGGLLLFADLADPVLQDMVRVSGAAFLSDPRPTILVAFVLIIIVIQIVSGYEHPAPALLSPLLYRPSIRAALLSLFIVIALSAFIFTYMPIHSGKAVDGFTFLSFGILTSLTFSLYSVLTVIIPTIAFITLTLCFRILSASGFTSLLPFLLCASLLLVIVFIFAHYISFLRRQTRSVAILLDLVATFSLTTFFHSLGSVAGAEGFLPTRNVSLFDIDTRVAFFGALGVAAVLLLVPAILFICERYNRNKIGTIDPFANIYSLTSPLISTLHGYRALWHVIPLAGFIIGCALLAAYFHAAWAMGISHDDYGLIPGLKALALALVGAYSNAFLYMVLIAAILSMPYFLLARAGGLTQAVYAVLGICVVLAIITMSNKRKAAAT